MVLFYWRDAFYRGNVLRTDLSYIFVAVYEIINRAYPAGRESLERMLSLWESYREAFPRLDYYMSQWCADYVLTNDIAFDFSEILRRIPLAVSNMRPFLELYVNDALKTGLHALPFDILCEFSEYSIRNSRFYKGHEDLCRGAVRAALSEIDRSLRAAKQIGLLEYLAPRPKREVWDAYQGAVCGRAAAKRVEAEYLPYSKSAGIRSFVGSVMRYVENALRKREKYAGRLRGITLSDAVQRAIDRSLTAKTAEKNTGGYHRPVARGGPGTRLVGQYAPSDRGGAGCAAGRGEPVQEELAPPAVTGGNAAGRVGAAGHRGGGRRLAGVCGRARACAPRAFAGDAGGRGRRGTGRDRDAGVFLSRGAL